MSQGGSSRGIRILVLLVLAIGTGTAFLGLRDTRAGNVGQPARSEPAASEASGVAGVAEVGPLADARRVAAPPDEVRAAPRPSAVRGDRPFLRIDWEDLKGEAASEAPFFGRVVAADTGEPLSGAVVRVQWLGDEGTWDLDPSFGVLTTDAEGRFETRSGGLFRLAAIEKQGFTTGYLQLDRAHTAPERPATARLAPEASLRVRILGEYELPEAAMLVTLVPAHGSSHSFASSYLPGELLPTFGMRATTDAEGFCAFDGLPAGVELGARLSRGGYRARMAAPVVLDPGEERHVVWRLSGRVDLRGFVYDEVGEPVSGLTLWLGRPSEGRPRYFTRDDVDDVFASTVTSPRGGFFFRDIPPGRWAVGPADAKRGFAPHGRLVDVPEGVTEHSFTLRIRSGLSIRGVVLDAAGEPAKRVDVDAESVDDGAGFRARCDNAGRFTVGPLLPGTYRVGAGGSEPVYAEAGDEGVELRLPAR